MKTYKLHLIRHGSTDANLEGIYCGSTDVPLNDIGRSELYENLDEFTYPYAEWVFSSPLRRAAETAGILYPGVEIIEFENLREASFGEFEGKRMSELQNHPKFAGWAAGVPGVLPDGAEPAEMFRNRCAGAAISIIDMMMKAGVHSAAAVTHAGVIGGILAALAYPRAPVYEWNATPGHGFTVLADPTIFFREPVLEVISAIPVPNGESLPPEEDDPFADLDWRE